MDQNTESYSTHPDFIKISKLISGALPRGISLQEIISEAPPSLLAKNPRAAFAYAIRKFGKIDWNKYRQFYEDVNRSDIDPCLHFIRHGIFEGRHLFISDNGASLSDDQPKVSIVLINFNNGIYLDKAIASVINQSLRDIELIIVDDASIDESSHIISEYAKEDRRIKFIQHKHNQSQHMARKHGVAVATGKYIMFLDSDDFYENNACELAYELVNDQYDIGCYNFNVIPMPGLDLSDASLFKQSHTVEKEQILNGREIILNAFFYYRINPLLWNKIYKADICKKAFASLEGGYFPNGQDIWAFIACAVNAKSYIHKDITLYNYRMGSGVSYIDNTTQKITYSYHRAAILKPLENFCENHGIINVYKKIKSDFFKRNLSVLMKLVPGSEVNSYFNKIADEYGIMYVMGKLIETYFENWLPVARLFSNYKIEYKRKIKTIGIFYYRISLGGVETIISSLCKIFKSLNYKVKLFIEERSENDMYFGDSVEIIYISSSKHTPFNMKNHVSDLYHVLKQSDIDLMVYNYTWSWCLLWDSMILHLLNIPIIVYHHGDFTYDFIDFGKKYNYKIQNAIFKCTDKVITLSPFSELFFRMHGVDAEYVPNPVNYPKVARIKPFAGPNILFLARLEDRNKQIREALMVLKEVIKAIPEAYMYFVGDFDTHEQTIRFYEVARELGVGEKIALIGWSHQPARYFDKCSVLLSTSHWESFGMSMAEAQTYGLPCVAYYVPTMVVDQNEGIISVTPNDYKAAAKNIVRLLTDKPYWQQISKKASVSQAAFSFEEFGKRIRYLLENFQISSTYHQYTRHDYEVVIKSIAHFATVGPRQTKL